jgi:hypothetical protein
MTLPNTSWNITTNHARPIYTIPVGKMNPKKKKWWQFWRKKGDSAEEALADMMSRYTVEWKWKSFERKSSIHRIYKIDPIPAKLRDGEYWFPNR